MTNEEWDKKAEFILNQQAQFSADIEQLREIVTRLATAALNRFEETEAKTAEKFGDVDAKIAALVDSQIRTEEIAKENTENIRNLAAVVNRYFSERDGGANAGG